MSPSARLSAALLCVVWTSEIVRIFQPVPWLGGLGAVCLATYMAMALRRASVHIRAVFVLAMAAATAIAFHLDSARPLLAGFDKGQIFGAFLPAALVLRATVESSDHVIAVRTSLRALQPEAVQSWTQFCSHALGSVLNAGATSMLAPVVAPGADKAERAELARSSARGVGGAVVWSPFFPALAFTSQLVPHVPLWQAMLIGAGLAVVGFFVSYAIFTPRLGWRDFFASLTGLRSLLGPLSLLMGAVVGSTVVFGWSGLQSVAFVVPMICAGYLVSAGWATSRQVARNAASSFSLLSNELLIVVGATILGASIAALPEVERLGAAFNPNLVAGPLLLAAVILVLLVLGQAGLHPMIGASIVVPLMAAGDFGVCGPVLIATTVFAWALFGSTSIWALPVVAAARFFEVPPREMLSRKTALYLVCYVSVAYPSLVALNWILGSLGCR